MKNALLARLIACFRRGFQNGRNSSILGQRFMTNFSPAASASRAASSLRTPNCAHSTFAPISIASRAIPGSAAELRKTSTMSTGRSIAARDS